MKKVIQFSSKLRQAMTQLKGHKLMHKIGKQWVVIGISALVLSFSGMALSSTTHAADVQNNDAVRIQTQAKALHTQIIQSTNRHSDQLQDHNAKPKNTQSSVKSSRTDQKSRVYGMQADHADENDGLAIIKNSSKSNQRRPVKRNHRARRGKRSIRRPRIRRNRGKRAHRISYVSSSAYHNYQRQIRNLQRQTRRGTRYSRRIARRLLTQFQRQFKNIRVRKTVRKRRTKRIRRQRVSKPTVKKNRRRTRRSRRPARKSSGIIIDSSDNNDDNNNDQSSTSNNRNFTITPSDDNSNQSDNQQPSDNQNSMTVQPSDNNTPSNKSDQQPNDQTNNQSNQTNQGNNVTPSDQQSDQTSQSDQNAQPSNSQSSNGSDQSSQSDSTPSTDTLLQQMKDRTLNDINNDRAQYGRSPLQENSDMMKLGQERADQTASLGQLQHYDSNGQMYETEDANQMGTNLGNRWGENLSGADLGNMTMEGDPNQFDNHNGNDMADMAEDAMLNHDQNSGWGHRHNILDSRFTTIGIGASQSNGHFYIAEDFGN